MVCDTLSRIERGGIDQSLVSNWLHMDVAIIKPFFQSSSRVIELEVYVSSELTLGNSLLVFLVDLLQRMVVPRGKQKPCPQSHLFLIIQPRSAFTQNRFNPGSNFTPSSSLQNLLHVHRVILQNSTQNFIHNWTAEINDILIESAVPDTEFGLKELELFKITEQWRLC